jgi:predicted MFS family arabinose efflux permease
MVPPAPRRQAILALTLVGALVFLGVYSPQPLLPSMRHAFGATEGEAAAVISSLAAGVALAAPGAGVLSDRIGRRRLILLASVMASAIAIACGLAPSLRWLLALRFLQGCVTPAILTSAMAYATEEFVGSSGAATSAYVTGTVAGGFVGRLIASALVGRWGWSGALIGVGVAMLTLTAVVARSLPPSRGFARGAEPPLVSLRGALRSRTLWSAHGVGFSALFSLVGIFTFVCFRLARPPFSLGPLALGALFVVYLAGLPITPLAGRLIDRLGPRSVARAALLAAALGVLLTLSSRLPILVLGLGACACGVFVLQAATSTWVARGSASRATASGLYLSAYYAGGAAAGPLLAPCWSRGGWPAVTLAILAVQALAQLCVQLAWRPAQRGP